MPFFSVSFLQHCTEMWCDVVWDGWVLQLTWCWLAGWRDMAMRRIFWGFCRNWFLLSPLHYLLSRSDLAFKFAEIFVIEKRLPNSVSLGVSDSLTRWVEELLTLWLGESWSRRLSDSVSWGVDDSLTHQRGEFSHSIADSLIRQVEESATPRLGELDNRRLLDSTSRRVGDSSDSTSRGVADSPTRRIGESFFDYEYLREFEAKNGTARNVV